MPNPRPNPLFRWCTLQWDHHSPILDKCRIDSAFTQLKNALYNHIMSFPGVLDLECKFSLTNGEWVAFQFYVIPRRVNFLIFIFATLMNELYSNNVITSILRVSTFNIFVNNGLMNELYSNYAIQGLFNHFLDQISRIKL